MTKGEKMLATAPVGKVIWKLALPAVLTTLISTIYNLTDTYFIGLMRDTSQLSAVSAAMPYMWLFSALWGIFAAGAPQLISLSMGKGEDEQTRRLGRYAILASGLAGLLLTPVGLALMEIGLQLVGARGDVLRHGCEYLRWILLSGVFSALGGSFQGVLRAHGRSLAASLSSAAGILVNIALDPVMIFALDMGIGGAGLATALGSVASFAVGAACLRPSLKGPLPEGQMRRRVLLNALPATVNSIILCCTMGFSLALASGDGGNTMAAISVASKLYSVVVSIVSALAYSMQPFIGYHFGAGEYARLRRGMAGSLWVGMAFCLAGMGVFLAAGGPLMGLFTQDAELIAQGRQMLRCLCVGLPVAALQMNALSYLSGTGKAVGALIVSLCRQLVIFLPMVGILNACFGFVGLALAYPVTDVLSTIPALILCARDRRLYARKGAQR